VAHALARADAGLEAENIAAGPPSEAMQRLICSSWRLLDQHRRLLAAAQQHLAPGRLREHHDRVMDRVRELVVRGQNTGEFRTDLPCDWLVTSFYHLLHAAAEEVDAGRLEPSNAGEVLAATVLSVLRAGQRA
jgi:hypothetical protein